MKIKLRNYCLYFTIFITGAAVLVMEILGTRLLAPFYGSTIYVWSSLITVTLGALAVGYYVGGVFIDRYPKINLFYQAVILAGFTFIIPTKIDQYILPLTDRLGLRFGPLAASVLLFFIPLFILGMTSPMAIRLMSSGVEVAGKVAGRVFALSTFGSIAGALAGGFFLIQYFAISQILIATSFILIVIGMGVLYAERFMKIKTLVFISALLLLIAFVVPQYTFPDDRPGLKIVYQQQGFYSDLKAVEGYGLRCILADGTTESCVDSADGSVANFFNELGAIVNSRSPENVLILGSGGGNLVATLDTDMQVDLVDIDPGVIRLGVSYLGITPNDNQRIFIDDARRFINMSDSKYDLIFLDLAKGHRPPYYMFSQESFISIKNRLNENGLILVHFLGGIGKEDKAASSVIKTIKSVFPSVIVTTANPDENVSYIIHASLDEDYNFAYKPKYGISFVPAEVVENGELLTDDFNPLDTFYERNAVSWLASIRNFGGFKSMFSL